MPDYLAINAVPVDNDWGDIFSLGRIDDLSIKPVTNDILLRLSPKNTGRGYDWGQPIRLQSGGYNNFSDGVFKNYSHFQLKRAIAGAAATADIKAFEV